MPVMQQQNSDAMKVFAMKVCKVVKTSFTLDIHLHFLFISMSFSHKGSIQYFVKVGLKCSLQLEGEAA